MKFSENPSVRETSDYQRSQEKKNYNTRGGNSEMTMKLSMLQDTSESNVWTSVRYVPNVNGRKGDI